MGMIELVANTAKDILVPIVVAADNSLKTSGTIYAVIRLEDDGDGSDGYFWTGAAWAATISDATAPTATHIEAGVWHYALPAGASTGRASGHIKAWMTDDIDTPGSATVVSGPWEAYIREEDPLVAGDVTGSSASAIADAVLLEIVADHSGTPGSLADVVSSGTSASAVADAVLLEIVSDHSGTAGSLAAIIASLGSASVTVASGIAFEQYVMMRQKIRYNDDNDDNPFTYQRKLNGIKVTPSSATIEIFKPGSTTAVLAATAMSISGTIATYAIDTTTIADFPAGTGFRARILATIDGTVYPDDLIFDVAKNLLVLDIGYDQLVAIDDRITGMAHAGDETFSNLITGVRDEMQLRIETASLGNKQFVESMMLDKSRVSIPARYKMLERIFRSKGQHESANQHRDDFKELWRAMLHGVQFDKNGDQQEDGEGSRGRTNRSRMTY